MPTMSLGMRSGVHWMRENEPDVAEAIVVAAVVFASPGTDSRSTCPRASSEATNAVYKASWPTTRLSKIVWMRSRSWLERSMSSAAMLPDAIPVVILSLRLPASASDAH